MRYEVSVGDKIYQIELQRGADSASSNERSESLWNVRLKLRETHTREIDGREMPINCLRVRDGVLSLIVNGQSFEVRVNRSAEMLTAFLHGKSYDCTVRDPRSFSSRKRAGANDAGEQRVTSSMPGKVVRVLVREGEAIKAGEGILVIEAMKMQNEVRAPKAGKLKSVIATQGANVNAGEVLAIIE
jgi:biotin carboxyl carrier protein